MLMRRLRIVLARSRFATVLNERYPSLKKMQVRQQVVQAMECFGLERLSSYTLRLVVGVLGYSGKIVLNFQRAFHDPTSCSPFPSHFQRTIQLCLVRQLTFLRPRSILLWSSRNTAHAMSAVEWR